MEIRPNHFLEDANADDGDGGVIPPWSFGTNWTVTSGSLDTSVTVESSDSFTDHDNGGEPVESFRGLQPLMLKSPSSDSGPCEIKICFRQKYEVQQVYVRSTARVYELYYAPSPRATNQYLATVRCSTAERDGETLQVTDVQNFTEHNTKFSAGELTEAKCTSESSGSTSEDDWVQVKVHESPYHANGNGSLVKQNSISGRSSFQDLHEATAQISDADPCTSITIRLLSLQTKCCVHVDEVYVFADLVGSSDLENQPVQIGSSSGSALMAMLVPTLMQLSKSSASQVHDKNPSIILEKDAETESKSMLPTNVANAAHQAEKLSAGQQNVNLHDYRAEPSRVQPPNQDPVINRRDGPSVETDLPHARIEGLLEQLISRVSRVEDVCLRFEENVLKPINNIEARLQQVEQQLEVVSRNFHYSGQTRGTRISAPSFSCGGSNSSSIYEDSVRHTPSGTTASERKDHPCTDEPKLSNDIPISDLPHSLPGLVITAPEFSCGEDDEDNDVHESPERSPVKNPKPHLSIDDALAAALSGFLSMTNAHREDIRSLKVPPSVCTTEATGNHEPDAQTLGQAVHEEHSKCTEVLSIAAPDLTMEVGDNKHPECVESSTIIASQCMSEKEDGTEDIKDTQNEVGNPEICFDACIFRERGTMPTDDFSVGNGKQDLLAVSLGDKEPYQPLETEVKRSFVADGECTTGLAGGFDETDDHSVNEKSGPMEPSSEMPYLQNDSAIMLSPNQDEDKLDTMESVAEGPEFLAVNEVLDTTTTITLNLTKSTSVSQVDLEFPIFDVKFASHESSISDSPLEVLLSEAADVNAQIPQFQEVSDVTSEQTHCISLGDDKAVGAATDNVLLLDVGINAEVAVSPDLGGGPYDSPRCSNRFILTSLI